MCNSTGVPARTKQLYPCNSGNVPLHPAKIRIMKWEHRAMQAGKNWYNGQCKGTEMRGKVKNKTVSNTARREWKLRHEKCLEEVIQESKWVLEGRLEIEEWRRRRTAKGWGKLPQFLITWSWNDPPDTWAVTKRLQNWWIPGLKCSCFILL